MSQYYRRSTVAVMVAAITWLGHASEAQDEKGGRELVWGSPFKGLAISAHCRKYYRAGEDVEVFLAVRNLTDSEIQLLNSDGASELRVAVFHLDGRPVLPRREATPASSARSRRHGIGSVTAKRIPPKSVPSWREYIRLNRQCSLDEPGTYVALVMRRVTSWDDGFLVSNMIKFEIRG